MSRSTATRLLRSPAPQGVAARARRPSPVLRPPLGNGSSAALPAPPPAPDLTTKALSTMPMPSFAGPESHLPESWFSARFPPRPQLSFNNTVSRWSTQPLGTNPDKPPDDRNVKLGKTLRILRERLPTLLQSPLPQEILSPNISLHLFPSTHPHLPKVSGRVAYIAALWTSPIAWNRVPIIGNVRLEVLSSRMVSVPPIPNVPRRAGAVGESFIVRWRTVGKSSSWGLSFINGDGGGSKGEAVVPGTKCDDTKREFTGLFIFDFDKEGRVLSHTIEHVEEGGQWEKGVGAKVVSHLSALLAGIRNGGKNETPLPAAFAAVETKKD